MSKGLQVGIVRRRHEATNKRRTRGSRSALSQTARPLAGAGLVVAIVAIVVLAVSLFRGGFTEAASVTVISDRAGLVMNPDAKVKLREIQVGTVRSIETRPDGSAALHLAIDPAQLRFIPSNVGVDIAASTVFGSKYVQLETPPDPTPQRLHAGQVVQGKSVTVEANTLFEQLRAVLAEIDPAKLNQTLGAIATALNGRGHTMGQTLSELNRVMAKIEPSLQNLGHVIESSVPTLTAYADSSPDLIDILDRATRLSDTVVDEQRNLDAFLVSTIGLADTSNDVIGSNSDALTELLHVLIPTTDVLRRYDESLWCSLAGLIPFAKMVPSPVPGAMIAASLTMGTERYRYPQDLPKVAAKGRSYCSEVGLPNVAPGARPPLIVGDVGANPARYGNQGLLLNSDALKQYLFGPIDGPPRNTAQVGMPG